MLGQHGWNDLREEENDKMRLEHRQGADLCSDLGAIIRTLIFILGVRWEALMGREECDTI